MGRIAVSLAALAVVPSILPFASGDPERICVAAKDGWARERAEPTPVDWDAFAGDVGAPPVGPRDTPERRAEYVAAVKAQMATPGYQHVVDHLDWSADTGACLDEAHDRMLLSGVGSVPAVALAIGLRLRRRP
jgi:hypothetical protein